MRKLEFSFFPGVKSEPNFSLGSGSAPGFTVQFSGGRRQEMSVKQREASGGHGPTWVQTERGLEQVYLTNLDKLREE